MHRTILFSLALLLSACSPYSEEQLHGHWQGTHISEDGITLDVAPELISLSFSPTGRYSYEGTLQYRESGQFSIQDHLLFTTDTLQAGVEEKAVEILLLSPDSLHLQMWEGGKARLLKLAKQ